MTDSVTQEKRLVRFEWGLSSLVRYYQPNRLRIFPTPVDSSIDHVPPLNLTLSRLLTKVLNPVPGSVRRRKWPAQPEQPQIFLVCKSDHRAMPRFQVLGAMHPLPPATPTIIPTKQQNFCSCSQLHNSLPLHMDARNCRL